MPNPASDKHSRIRFIAENGMVAALWPVVINGLIVGTEIYFMFNEGKLPLAACMGWVALGELIAMAVGYAVFMILMRNKPAMRLLAPTRHAEVRF